MHIFHVTRECNLVLDCLAIKIFDEVITNFKSLLLTHYLFWKQVADLCICVFLQDLCIFTRNCDILLNRIAIEFDATLLTSQMLSFCCIAVRFLCILMFQLLVGRYLAARCYVSSIMIEIFYGIVL